MEDGSFRNVVNYGVVDDAAVSGEAGGLAPFIEELSPGESAAFYLLAEDVFSRPRHFGFESGDEAAEAFLCYKVRLRTIIRKSRTISGNPGAYIDSCLRFLAKSVRRSHRKKEISDLVLASSGGSDDCLALVSSPGPAEEDLPESAEAFSDIAPSWFLARLRSREKRLLFLALKCAWEIDADLEEKVARRIGVPSLWLCGLLHQARASVEGSRECLVRLHERKNALWVKSRLLESQLEDRDLSPDLRLSLERRAVLCRSQYLVLQERISKYKLLVSNRVVAEILRVPKGSVDSGLFYLRTQDPAKDQARSSA
jgi:hypothetical protein